MQTLEYFYATCLMISHRLPNRGRGLQTFGQVVGTSSGWRQSTVAGHEVLPPPVDMFTPAEVKGKKKTAFLFLNCIFPWYLINYHRTQSTDPPNPPAPTELRVTNMGFGPGRTVAARVQWSMTSDLDVPVHHYKVSWSWTVPGQPSASSLTKRRKIVREVSTKTRHFFSSFKCFF